MTHPGIEYILHVWEEKPTDLTNLSTKYWRAHVTDASGIPRIGESIFSDSGFDECNLFRVFEVRYKIGSVLSELVTSGRSELKETKTPEGEKGLPTVLAYAERN